MTDRDDEFWLGIWWVQSGFGPAGWRNATPSECAAEIQRLRKRVAELEEAAEERLLRAEGT